MKKNKFISIISAVTLAFSAMTNAVVSADTNVILGDINSDGMITAVDASWILSEYAQTSAGNDSAFNEIQRLSADVNKDGIIDAVDATYVLGYYAFISLNDDVITLEAFIKQKIGSSYLSPADVDFSSIPSFTDTPYTILNENIPTFDISECDGTAFEYYSDLDELGRCGVCVSCVGKETMPIEKRGEIGMVKPSGWQISKYDHVDGKYLYNRCHLIGYQLTAENANVNNLITGTRYLNVKGMLSFEDKIASYVEKTDNHVLYRVTPIFIDDELVCRGVAMEGWSIEDSGAGICFNVFCYNVQPGVIIDYATGENCLDEAYIATSITTSTTVTTTTVTTTVTMTQPPSQYDYIGNSKSKVFHKPDCPSVKDMNDDNKKYFTGSREDIIAEGYKPCSRCNP